MKQVKRTGRKPKYDYENIFEQALKHPAIRLTQGDDFDCSVQTMKHNLYKQQKPRGLKIKTVEVSPEENGGNPGVEIKATEVTSTDSKSKTTTKKKETASKA